MRSVCVFCGASPGNHPSFLQAASALGQALAESQRVLVYGGAKVGLMGATADAALAAGGKVIGVLPQTLVEREVAHPGLTELHIVSGMHERKTRMAELADAFIMLPGGLGTLEEFFEVWTWAQLGLHQKPIGMLGSKTFFSPLVSYLDHLEAHGFVRPQHRQMVTHEEEPHALLARLAQQHQLAAPSSPLRVASES